MPVDGVKAFCCFCFGAACNSSHHDIPSAWPALAANTTHPLHHPPPPSAPAALLVLIQFNNLFSLVLLFFRSPLQFFAQFASAAAPQRRCIVAGWQRKCSRQRQRRQPLVQMKLHFVCPKHSKKFNQRRCDALGIFPSIYIYIHVHMQTPLYTWPYRAHAYLVIPGFYCH